MTLAIIGCTASGKSAVALASAESVPGVHVVSVDAMQVYRRMDIGTAKPTSAERARVPHHLIDLVEPGDEFTVARFQRAHAAARREIDRSGGTALLVGGTGLYVRAVVDQLEIPGQWPDVRRRLESEAESGDVVAMYERLGRLDPMAAERIEPSNARRIVRALEVIEGSGRAFSSFGPGFDDYRPTDITMVGLRWDRDVLAERIERRVRSMMDAGWLDEVRGLLAESVPMSRTARQALGYKELIDHELGHLSLDDAIDRIVLRTRQFAVRQERWFRRDPRIRWFDVRSDPVAEVAPRIGEMLTRDAGLV